MNGSGFDPSLFHDDDGRKWFVNQRWDHRQGRNRFDGIVLQEYDHHQQKLVGPITNIWAGELGCTEGPHLLKKTAGIISYVRKVARAMSMQSALPVADRSKGPMRIIHKTRFSQRFIAQPFLFRKRDMVDLLSVQMAVGIRPISARVR